MVEGAITREIILKYTADVQSAMNNVRRMNAMNAQVGATLGRQAKLVDPFEGAIKNIAKESNRFKAEWLSVMFIGMYLNRVFSGLWKNMMTSFMAAAEPTNTFRMGVVGLQAAFTFLGFSIFNSLSQNELIMAMVNGFIGLVDWIANLTGEFPGLGQAITILMGLLIALSSYFFIASQFALLFSAKGGLAAVGTAIKALYAPLLILNGFLWSTAFSIGAITIPVWALFAALGILAIAFENNWLGIRDIVLYVGDVIISVIAAIVGMISFFVRATIDAFNVIISGYNMFARVSGFDTVGLINTPDMFKQETIDKNAEALRESWRNGINNIGEKKMLTTAITNVINIGTVNATDNEDFKKKMEEYQEEANRNVVDEMNRRGLTVTV